MREERQERTIYKIMCYDLRAKWGKSKRRVQLVILRESAISAMPLRKIQRSDERAFKPGIRTTDYTKERGARPVSSVHASACEGPRSVRSGDEAREEQENERKGNFSVANNTAIGTSSTFTGTTAKLCQVWPFIPALWFIRLHVALREL